MVWVVAGSVTGVGGWLGWFCIWVCVFTDRCFSLSVSLVAMVVVVVVVAVFWWLWIWCLNFFFFFSMGLVVVVVWFFLFVCGFDCGLWLKWWFGSCGCGCGCGCYAFGCCSCVGWWFVFSFPCLRMWLRLLLVETWSGDRGDSGWMKSFCGEYFLFYFNDFFIYYLNQIVKNIVRISVL